MGPFVARVLPRGWSPAAGGVLAVLVGWAATGLAIFVGLTVPLGPDGKGAVLVGCLVLALALVGAALQRYCARWARPNPRGDAWFGTAGFVAGSALDLWFVLGVPDSAPTRGPVLLLIPGGCTALALYTRKLLARG